MCVGPPLKPFELVTRTPPTAFVAEASELANILRAVLASTAYLWRSTVLEPSCANVATDDGAGVGFSQRSLARSGSMMPDG